MGVTIPMRHIAMLQQSESKCHQAGLRLAAHSSLQRPANLEARSIHSLATHLRLTVFQGCTIDWKKNKNVTVKTIKKKQKHKSRGSVRTITKTIQNDSFFNFFSPPVSEYQCVLVGLTRLAVL
jgi:hypothetical protein